MKAIYKGQIYWIHEVDDNNIELLLLLPLDDPRLIIDPTDAQLEECQALLTQDEVIYRGG